MGGHTFISCSTNNALGRFSGSGDQFTNGFGFGVKLPHVFLCTFYCHSVWRGNLS